MTLQELKTGDLIFFKNSIGFIEHIALFANYKDGIPYIIHAITAPYHSVMLTSLRQADEHCSYLVMRPKQTEISLIATGILYRWVELQVPFASTEKMNEIIDLLENMGGFDCPDAGKVQEPLGKQTYLSRFWQYNELVHALPFVPLKDGQAEGMFCSETIINAFNAAMLISEVRALELLGRAEWTVDRYLTLSHYIENLDNPLPFDAKTTFPAGIYEHCLKDTTHWLNLEVLEVNPEINDDIAKGKGVWREFKQHLLLDASEKVRNCLASPTNLVCSDDVSEETAAACKNNLLFFAPIGPMSPRSRSSPMRFLDEV